MIEHRAVERDPIGEPPPTPPPYLHPQGLQRSLVDRAGCRAIRPELDHRAGLQQGLDKRQHCAGPGVAIGFRHAMIDHQDDGARPGAIAGAQDLCARLVVLRRKQVRPPCDEGVAVKVLVCLYAMFRVGTVRYAFKMLDHGARLIQHLVAGLTQPERKIGILEIGRRVTWIEATQGSEQSPRHQQGRTGAIIHLANIVVFGLGGIVAPPVIPPGAVVPDDTTGFLQSPVGVDELGAHRARVRPSDGQRQHRVQPSDAWPRVVVEKQQIFTAGQLCGCVAGTHEAQVERLPDQPNAINLIELGNRGIARCVIDDDHLDGGRRRMRGDRGKAVQRACGLAVGGDDDRHRGTRRARQVDV
jgi:hypothetical protein